MKLKPILKYAGGKSKLLPQIIPHFPDFSNIKYYYEPFVGGGAVFFYLASNYSFDDLNINDKLSCLTNLYDIFNNEKNYNALKINLQDLIDEYWKKENKEDWYYSIRKSFNKTKDPEIKSAYFLILNKLCFNGLCRFNKSGDFNVPYGKYKNPKFYDLDNFENIRHYFKNNNVHVDNQDYHSLLNDCDFDKNTFVYLDPPYLPISKTSNFTSYTGSKFGADNVIKLGEFCKKLDKRNCKIMISHQAKNDETNKLIYDVFSDYNFYYIEGTHAMANKNQTNIKEFVITNY